MFRKLPQLTEVPSQLHHDPPLHLTDVLLSSALCLLILTHTFKVLGTDIPEPCILKRNLTPAIYYVRIPKNLISLNLEGKWLSKLFVSLFIVSGVCGTVKPVSACHGSGQLLH